MKRNNELVYWVRKTIAERARYCRDLVRVNHFPFNSARNAYGSMFWFLSTIEDLTGTKFTNRKSGMLRNFYVYHKD